MTEIIQTNKFRKLFIKGFVITSLTALFAGMGVYLMLFILELLPVSRNMLVFLTVLLYALAFAIAKAGMNLKLDFYPFSVGRDDADDSDRKQVPIRRPFILKIFTVIWVATGICAVFWLTPAFIIFWYSLHYPNQIIMIFSFVSGLFAAILYYFLKDDIITTIKDRLVFFTGSSSGVIIALFIIYHFMSNRVFVTWE
ncbi:MAG: hypothetical protein JW944_00025 [Deltaproteobacteria bacterium]|nr:hypothetical protein [Deltaproteobacteria bacterium]